jgi:hypothetical protein
MSDLAAIIKATRASANALESMARFARDIAHNDRTIAWHALMVSRGLMSAEHAQWGDSICIADKNRAMRGQAKARGRYERAQLILARNPI